MLVGFAGDDISRIELAVEEAVSNVVQHAFLDDDEPGAFDIGCEQVTLGLRIIIREKGIPFAPDRAAVFEQGDDTTLVSLGEQRAWSLYPVMDLLNSGAALTCGTDWPFSGELNTFNPLESIQIGVTRRGLNPQEAQAQSYNPAQCVSLATMLHAHTLGGAHADFQEDVTGSIRIGKSADLVVLDRDIHKTSANEISQANISLTMFQGNIIHRAPNAE